jgi:hypothetical protein
MKPARHRQSGIALAALLVLLVLAGGYAFYRTANQGGGQLQRDAEQFALMNRAKEALIAYAVVDEGRPGRLPCPDATDNPGMNSYAYDGKSDYFTLIHCPTYIGWLPWVTLGIPELLDDTGTRLWYTLSPGYRDNTSAQPINSDTPATLQFDGGADIAALIFAPRGALAGQSRRTNNVADYLDGENSNGDTAFISGPPGPAFNDQVVAITRRELMAAVEKKVANSLKTCLEEHATSPANLERSYPWPAPLAATDYRGTAGSLFGQVAQTEPGAGPEAKVKESISALGGAREALAAAPTATGQLAALQAITQAATYAQALFDKTFAVASALAQVAGSTASAFNELNSDIDAAASSGLGISNRERDALRADAISVKVALATLQTSLADSGIDVFPGELARRNGVLRLAIDAARATPSAGNLAALAISAGDYSVLYARSATPNPDIGAALGAALASANAAQVAAANAAARPGDTALASSALAAADGLFAATSTLRDTIQPIASLSANEIQIAALEVQAALADFAARPTTEGTAKIDAELDQLRVLLNRLSSESTAILALRSSALAAIDIAITAARAANDFALIQTTTDAALAPTYTLARTVAGSRTNLPAGEISAQAGRTTTLLTTFNAERSKDTAAGLAAALTALQNLANRLVTNSSPVVAARNATLASVATALAAANAAADFPAIDARTNAAIADASSLAAAIASNGDNVLRESLAAAAARYEAAQTVFNVITPPPPAQRNRVPYARALQTPAADIAFWAQLTATTAGEIATLARRAPSATVDDAQSAYSAATTLIAGQDGTQGAVQAYINAPTSAARAATAAAAVATTTAQLDSLLARAGALDARLDSGTAEAQPLVWHATACTFLQPGTGKTSWWTANEWSKTLFYQVSDRVRPATGKLTIDGIGTYPVVVIAAGAPLMLPAPLNPQNRTIRTSAQFFEAANADPSRDGEAKAPKTAFASAPASATFNDRLAY